MSEPSIIACRCGAAYERREAQLPIRDIGLFECHTCGVQLEYWSGRTVPVFTRIESTPAQRKSA